jgi:hypothetical protein
MNKAKKWQSAIVYVAVARVISVSAVRKLQSGVNPSSNNMDLPINRTIFAHPYLFATMARASNSCARCALLFVVAASKS